MKEAKIPNPFETGYTEWTVAGIYSDWINRIFRDKSISYRARIEKEILVGQKRPDLIIEDKNGKPLCLIEFKRPSWDVYADEVVKDAFWKADKIKAPYFGTSNFNRLLLFGTDLYDKKVLKEKKSFYEAIINHFEITDMRELEEVEKAVNKIRIQKFFEDFLQELILIATGKKARPKLAIDEYFILYLRSVIDSLQVSYKGTIVEKAKINSKFLKDIKKWFREQCWSFTGSLEDYERIARQASYLLVNKILFYVALQEKYGLEQLEIPKSLRNGDRLQKELQWFFDQILKIDYETIFTTDFIDRIAFPEDEKAVKSVRDLINEINRYKISEVGYEVLGNIFENLIPEKERHKLGQYFTNADVVDIILKFCLQDENDFILDPACGAGTFLVRSYHHKKIINPRLKHLDILPTLWGIDVSKFASHLTTINLAVRDLGSKENYPRIVPLDFFNISPERIGFEIPFHIEKNQTTLTKVEKKVEHPDLFNVVVGNPPYTRQEEMEDLMGSDGYKDELIAKALTGVTDEIVDIREETDEKIKEIEKKAEEEINAIKEKYRESTGGIAENTKIKFASLGKDKEKKEKEEKEIGEIRRSAEEEIDNIRKECEEKIRKVVKRVMSKRREKEKLADISKRAGIHSYFFIHGYKFLKYGGRFGFVVSNSWLDVEYGKGLQEFFLRNYKILAVVESNVERWFPDADINTCIVILEKCKDKKERDKNFVRFVQLKKPLRHFIPKAGKGIEKEVERIREIDKLVKLIMFHEDHYENEEIRIFPKRQRELWKEGYDEKSEKYVGSKWGKYIRAPDIFFKVLEKGKDLFVPLKEVAEVRRGFTTGANKFFYLTEEEIKDRAIEKEFWMHKEGKKWIPNYVIKSPRECKSIIVDPKDLKYRVLMIHKDRKELKGTNVLKYIEWGEEQGFHERPTCASRKRWYDLGEREPGDFMFPYLIGERYSVPFNDKRCYLDNRLFDVYLKNKNNKIVFFSIMNSTLTRLFLDLLGRGMIGAITALDIHVYEVEQLLMPASTLFTKSQIVLLKSTFQKLSFRPIESVFSEIGANSPEEVSLDKVKPDRRELDKIIMGEILGLTEEEQLEVYKAVVHLVKSRIEKAKSVKKRKKKGGIDIDQAVDSILNRIGKDRLADFYKEKVLSQDHHLVKLPSFKREPMVEKTLEGWQLRSGKERIECESRKEADYCKIFASLGIEEIAVPDDLEYTANILKELKGIVNAMNEELESFTITDKKVRNTIQNKVRNSIIEGL